MCHARHCLAQVEPLRANTLERADTGVWEALAGFTFGTPDLVLLADGSVLLVYYARIEGVTSVRACSFVLKNARGASGPGNQCTVWR